MILYDSGIRHCGFYKVVGRDSKRKSLELVLLNSITASEPFYGVLHSWVYVKPEDVEVEGDPTHKASYKGALKNEGIKLQDTGSKLRVWGGDNIRVYLYW